MLQTFLIAFVASGQTLSTDSNPWLTVNPVTSSADASTLLSRQNIESGHDYVLSWSMFVEGQKPWRFRASFAGVEVHFHAADGTALQAIRFPCSCWQTPGWESCWVVFYAPDSAKLVDASVAIVSDEKLPGRFRVRDAKLLNLAAPPAYEPNEGAMRINVVDEIGAPLSARLYVIDESGNGHAPLLSYAYTQGTRCFHLTHPELSRIPLPQGKYRVEAMRGFEYEIAHAETVVTAGAVSNVTLRLKHKLDWNAKGWWSCDHHTHLFRHGGSLYPMIDLHDVYAVARGEGLNILPFMGVDKYEADDPEPREPTFIARYTEELTRDFWGHICPIGIHGVPDIGEQGDEWPMNFDVINIVRKQGGAIAYAHPYGPIRAGSEFAALANPKSGLVARGFPIDVALGAPCTLDILAKEDADGEFNTKLRDNMRILNLGLRVGVSGSTDFHLDQAREPIGGLRTYVHLPALTWDNVAKAYNEGHTFATNGPLVDLHIDDRIPGDVLTLDSPRKVRVHVEARSLWGIDTVEIWRDGKLFQTLTATKDAVDTDVVIDVFQSGWLLAIAKGPNAPEVMTRPEGKPCVDGQYAITSPVYFEVAGHPCTPDPAAATYFHDWVEAVRNGMEASMATGETSADSPSVKNRSDLERQLDKAETFYSNLAAEKKK